MKSTSLWIIALVCACSLLVPFVSSSRSIIDGKLFLRKRPWGPNFASGRNQQHWKRYNPDVGDTPTFRQTKINPLTVHRGGSTTAPTTAQADKDEYENEDDQDEERYSRQVYTLGAKAHGKVRSSSVYIDGPNRSGLVYECAKNLALSGVGSIVIVTSASSSTTATTTSNNNEENFFDDYHKQQRRQDSLYHNERYDDMGNAYSRAAHAELELDNTNSDSPSDDEDDDKISSGGGNVVDKEEDILVEFLRRLNPSVKVTKISRTELATKKMHTKESGILLCIDRPYDTQVDLNDVARELGYSFVSVETAGVYGKVFCDFGSQFEIDDIDGESPLVVPVDRLELVAQQHEDNENYDNDTEFLVHCVDGEKHDVSKGDKIEFHLSNGDKFSVSCAVSSVKNPRLFSVTLQRDSEFSVTEFVSKLNAEATSFSRVKVPVNVNFVPLREVMTKQDGSIFTPCDLDKSFDDIRRDAVMSCFQALPNFVRKEGRLPTIDDFDTFMTLVIEGDWSNENSLNNKNFEDHCIMFVRCCAAKLTPLQGVFGAIASQEALKAVTGLYNPIQQFLLYDCDEILDSSTDDGVTGDDSCSVTGQAYILGQEVETALSCERIFVVGSGAIGCEILKNLAAMRAGTGEDGRIIVTDMDTIERSNLSRQLLFRDRDIGKFKSVAAKQAVRRFNPLLKMETHTSKVGEGSDGPFDDRFWSKGIHVVLNALDNVEARLYMDQQCVANKKALVDAGTLGSKGNVQVVVPHQSESYGSSSDPPEPAIPVCTLKNFPYLIAHTIQWGRDLFDGLFVKRPKQLNDYVGLLSGSDNEQLAVKLIRDQGDEAAMNVAAELVQDVPSVLEEASSSIRDSAIEFACNLAREHFFDAIQNLLNQHPIDSVDEDGEPFWSGSRKAPTPLSFLENDNGDPRQSLINSNLSEFVRSAARLRIETYSGLTRDGSSMISLEEAKTALARNGKAQVLENKDLSKSVEDFVSESFELVSKCAESNLEVAEFEKDDDSNGHVAFITAASNLRALCYGIPPVDAMETRRVAGKIVPAMITTTAFVSALSCIELLKLVKGATVERHRNAFINLALPFFAFTMPLPAEELPGLRGQVHTLWDQITIKERKKDAAAGGMTLRRILKRLKAESCDEPDEVEISSVSYGQYMIYANFLHQDDDGMMKRSIWDLVEDAVTSGQEFDQEFSRDGAQDSDGQLPSSVKGATFLDLIVVVEDLETGEEVELPPVRVVKAKLKKNE